MALPQQPKEFEENVIAIDRVARVVKGGRRFRFRATVVIGDGKGRVGLGIGKGGEVTTAIAKAVARARRSLITVSLRDGTIPHEVTIQFSGAQVMLKPASAGTGVIAGGAVRSVVEAAGIHDLLTKSLGSTNKVNNAYATIMALSQLRQAEMPLSAARTQSQATATATSAVAAAAEDRPAAKPATSTSRVKATPKTKAAAT